MNKILHKIIFNLMIITILFYAALIVLYSISISEVLNCFPQSKRSDLPVMFSFITANIILLVITLIFGLHGTFFRITSRLLIYIIITGFISLIVMVGTICYYAKLIITEDFFKNNLLPWTMYIQTFIVGLDLILVILTIIERNDIFFEFNTSPLSQVNEKITEALYKNIISQSQNPEDQGLVNEYLRLSKTNSDVINSAGSSNECSKNNGKKQPFIGPEP